MQQETYTRDQLVIFGNYLLSEERKANTSELNQSNTTHADIENCFHADFKELDGE